MKQGERQPPKGYYIPVTSFCLTEKNITGSCPYGGGGRGARWKEMGHEEERGRGAGEGMRGIGKQKEEKRNEGPREAS